MTYNMTALQASDSFSKLIIYANSSTGDILVGLFVVAIFFVGVLALKRYDFDVTIPAMSFLCFIVSLLFSYAHMLHFLFPLGFGVVLALSTMYLYLSR